MSELFPSEEFLSAAELPPLFAATLEGLAASSEVLSLARTLRASCMHCAADEGATRWERCASFVRWLLSPESAGVLSRIANGARLAVESGKKPPFGSDRFARWVAFEHSFAMPNELLPLYLAATARAFPDVAKWLRVETSEAVLVKEYEWNPLNPKKS